MKGELGRIRKGRVSANKNLAAQSDEALARQVLKADQAAFAALVERFEEGPVREQLGAALEQRLALILEG